MLAEVFGAEQSLLFGGDGGEQDRAARLLLGLAEGAGQFEQDSAAGGVVVGAVVDVVTRHIGTNTKMVVVRGVEDGLVLQLAVDARQHSNDVIRLQGTNFAR